MKPNTVIAPIAVDRVATAEEVRAAIVPFPSVIEESATDVFYEIATDLGGYAHIPGAEFQASLMIEELNQEQDKWMN